jgi:hypothetical protein
MLHIRCLVVHIQCNSFHILAVPYQVGRAKGPTQYRSTHTHPPSRGKKRCVGIRKCGQRCSACYHQQVMISCTHLLGRQESCGQEVSASSAAPTYCCQQHRLYAAVMWHTVMSRTHSPTSRPKTAVRSAVRLSQQDAAAVQCERPDGETVTVG